MPFAGKNRCWQVKPTGNREKDIELGKLYAEDYLRYLEKSNGDLRLDVLVLNMLGNKKTQELFVEIGFLQGIHAFILKAL